MPSATNDIGYIKLTRNGPKVIIRKVKFETQPLYGNGKGG